MKLTILQKETENAGKPQQCLFSALELTALITFEAS